MLVFEEREKPDYPEKYLLKQRREPTTNSTHICSMDYVLEIHFTNCTKMHIPVYSNKALRLELFASPTSLYFFILLVLNW